MLMAECQFKAHVCSEKMKCLIGDCLKNSKSAYLSNDASFLLQNSPKFANLYLFNPTFTSIAQNSKINAVDSFQCTSYIKRSSSFSFIYISKNVFHAFDFRKGEEQDSTQEISVRANLQNDNFKVLSPAIMLSERDQAVLAYTQQDQFHLLLVQVNDRKRTLRALKLNDLNRPNGIISWITRQKPPHFENIKLLPFLAIDANNFRVLCIRDNSAAVFSVNFNNQQGTIKQAFICNTFSKTISRDDLLLDLLVLSQSKVLLVYSVKQRLVLVKMNIENDQSSLIIDSFKTSIPVNCLKILASKVNLYLSVYDEKSSTYKCFRNPLSELNTLTKDFKTLEPLLQFKDPIYFTTNSHDFFIISNHNILLVQDDCILNPSIPSQQTKIKSYQNWVERTYSKRMKKMVQQGEYRELQQVCEQKERRLIQQYSREERSGINNDAVKQRLVELIICTHIVKQIIANQQFEKLLQNIENPNIANELRQSDSSHLLEDTLIEQTPALIQDLLHLIIRMDMYLYLNDILEEIIKHTHKEHCQSTLNSIFSSLCETAIQTFPQSNSYDPFQYKQLLENIFDSIDVDEGCFVQQLGRLAQSQDNWMFLRNLVLNYQMVECFKHLFLTTKIEFQAKDVEEMVSSLEEASRQQYLRDFFGQLKQTYHNEEADDNAKVDLNQRCAVLMKGLLAFKQEIEGILNNSFPGLRAYFYLNQNTNHYSQQIKTIASKCEDPKVAYLLFLSTLNESNKDQLQNLERLRAQCHTQILLSNSSLISQSLAV